MIVLLFPDLRQSYMRLQRGEINKDVFLVMLATIFISTLALIGWCWLLKPDLSIYFGQIPNMPLILIPLAGLAFSVLNAVMEEFVFRGIIMNGASNAFKTSTISVLFQAVAFGLFHYHGGFPNGIIGASLTFVYGVLLGYIRNKSQGMMAPIVTHIFADLVLFSILITFVNMSTR
nr:CPBP family intramembrane glutamic endopeptidase [uncultured Desulfobacter sp.]